MSIYSDIISFTYSLYFFLSFFFRPLIHGWIIQKPEKPPDCKANSSDIKKKKLLHFRLL